MNTKRIVRWVIVLFLLAALPGMTAVMAQDQQPPDKEIAPEAVTDIDETTNVNYTYWEVEPNNTLAQARAVSIVDVAVWGGDVSNGDVDWYKFYLDAGHAAVLINTDARVDGKATDTVVKLYNSAGTFLSENDDMGGSSGVDSMLFAVLKDIGWYYVQVSDYGTPCTANCGYELMIGYTLLVSAAPANLGTGYVEGIPFRSEDILAFMGLQPDHYNNPQHKWMMLMDGSDIGIVKNVGSIGVGWPNPYGSLSLNFTANQVLRDWRNTSRTFTPWDWAEVEFARLGPNTELAIGSLGYPYIEYQPGTSHSLSTAAEKIDALDINGRYPGNPAWEVDAFFSTVGVAAVPKQGGGALKPADEDVFRETAWAGASAWSNTAFFDGSTVAGLAVEDIFAADYQPSRDRMHLVILGTGTVLGHRVTQKDIFSLDRSGAGWTWDRMFHLPDYGWNYNLDAIESGGG